LEDVTDTSMLPLHGFMDRKEAVKFWVISRCLMHWSALNTLALFTL
jgi:hypothetical protein